MIPQRVTALLTALLLVAGCAGDDGDDPAAAASDPVSLALAAEARPAADRERDAARKPGEVLAFFGIEPGMTVLDVFSGGGYYTEIAARIVGPSGRVIAHNNQAYLDYAAEEIAARYAGGRLANVERLDGPVSDIEPEAGSVDVALLILAYHDIYFRPDDGSWPRIDGPGMLRRIREALRTGGILGVVDHAGSPDITIPEIGRLHRIDEARLVREIEAAGFELVERSDVLRNPQDTRLAPMYDPEIRGRTDRLVLKFRKPE
ncbi:class I SAM-dependent methyltransferase [Lentisalinibacter orientalis]|uniref:class I SAM-dependent methyltransferase n=1 Tax=Lentisalinibacter orientalis TaxID=2992241 RepID=UPI00386C476D